MSEHSAEILQALDKIASLLELLAEDKIAERDAKKRAILVELVGRSGSRQRSIHLMDGTRTQADIHRETSLHKGDLSVLVSKLHKAKLLLGDAKRPHLNISLPANFFEKK